VTCTSTGWPRTSARARCDGGWPSRPLAIPVDLTRRTTPALATPRPMSTNAASMLGSTFWHATEINVCRRTDELSFRVTKCSTRIAVFEHGNLGCGLSSDATTMMAFDDRFAAGEGNSASVRIVGRRPASRPSRRRCLRASSRVEPADAAHSASGVAARLTHTRDEACFGGSGRPATVPPSVAVNPHHRGDGCERSRRAGTGGSPPSVSSSVGLVARLLGFAGPRRVPRRSVSRGPCARRWPPLCLGRGVPGVDGRGLRCLVPASSDPALGRCRLAAGGLLPRPRRGTRLGSASVCGPVRPQTVFFRGRA